MVPLNLRNIGQSNHMKLGLAVNTPTCFKVGNYVLQRSINDSSQHGSGLGCPHPCSGLIVAPRWAILSSVLPSLHRPSQSLFSQFPCSQEADVCPAGTQRPPQGYVGSGFPGFSPNMEQKPLGRHLSPQEWAFLLPPRPVLPC